MFAQVGRTLMYPNPPSLTDARSDNLSCCSPHSAFSKVSRLTVESKVGPWPTAVNQEMIMVPWLPTLPKESEATT